MLKGYLFGAAGKAIAAAMTGTNPKPIEVLHANFRTGKCACQLCQRAAPRITLKTQIHALAAHIGYAGRSARW